MRNLCAAAGLYNAHGPHPLTGEIALEDRTPNFDLFSNYYLPIIVVLLIAAFLRINGAGHFPVWTDEGWSTWAISEPTFNAIVDKLATDRHPPLYFLAVGFWSQIAGESRIALRLPSILVGIMTVAMVFRIGEETFGRTAKPDREDVSWYGMLMYALLPTAIYYSQEIRHFGWFVGAVCWSSLLFVRLLRNPTNRIMLLYAVSVALMMYLLYFGVWVVLVQVIVGFVLWRGDVRRNWRTSPADKSKLVGAWLLALLLYLPWLLVIFQQQWTILTGGITAAPGTFETTPVQLHQLLELLIGGGFALTAGLYIIGFWGALVSDRTEVTLGLRLANPAWLGELYIVAWGIILFALLAIVNVFTGVMSTRTLAFLSPAFMLVIGAGVVRLRTGVRWSLLAGYIAASVLLAPLIQPRLDYDVTANALAEGYSPGDLVVLETVWDDNAFRYEMRRALGNDANVIRTLPWVNNRDPYQPVIPQIENEIAAAERIWVVQWNSAPEVLPYLDNPANGFGRLRTLELSVGEQYLGRFNTVGGRDVVQVVLFGHTQGNADAVTFDDTFALTNAIVNETAEPGETLHIDLWWQALDSPALDYSVGVYLVNGDDEIVLQDDAPPQGVPPTSTWATDGTHYGDRRDLQLPDDLPPGDYTLETSVYFFETPDEPLPADDNETRPVIGNVTVE